ncbi:MAG: CoA transferase [Tetrasphaera sp.]
MTTSGSRLLDGVTVIDNSHYLAGPYLSRCLAAMGADVIKVERPTIGDAARLSPLVVDHGYSGYFMQQNMGKRGLCLNVKDPDGLDLFHRLVKKADVLVENLRPGAMKRMGLDYDSLAGLNPALVYCSISANGHTGPDWDRAGFGLIAEAKCGGMSMLGTPGEAPPVYGMSLADMYTGAHGVAAVCAALLGRVKTGKGQFIDLSLYDCMVSMHEYAVQEYLLSDGAITPPQMGKELASSIVYGVYAARDGAFVVAAQMEDSWKRLARVIGGEDLAADQTYWSVTGRNDNADRIRELIEAWSMSQESVADVVAELGAAGLVCSKIQTIKDVVEDPQIAARGMILDIDHPVLGPIRLPNHPLRFSDADTSPTRVAPTLGQHNAEIAAELGFSTEEIESLESRGILYAPAPAR